MNDPLTCMVGRYPILRLLRLLLILTWRLGPPVT